MIIITFIIVVAIWFQLSKDEPQQEIVISPKVIEQRPRATVPNNEIIPYPPQEISENIPPVKDSCQLPFSLPAKDFFVYTGGGYKGKDLEYIIDDDGNGGTQMDVYVNETRKPVALILSAYEPTIWQIRKTKDTQIFAVYVDGYHK